MGEREKESGPESGTPVEKELADEEDGATSDDSGYHRQQFHAPTDC